MLHRPLPADARDFLGPWSTCWHRFWDNHLPRMIGAAAFVSVAWAFSRAHNIYALYGDINAASAYLGPVIAYTVAAILFYAFVTWRKELMSAFIAKSGATRFEATLVPDRRPLREFKEIVRPARWILYASVLASPVFFVLFAFLPISTAAQMGSAVTVVLVGLSLAVASPSFIVIWAMRTKLPLLGTALLAFLVMPWLFGDNHDARTCRSLGSPQSTPSCVTDDFKSRPFIRQVFNDWHAANVKLTEPVAVMNRVPIVAPPMIVVATAGGASRAAYFTTQVFGEIAQREDNFADRVFLISGVSGGSLGATHFRSLIEADRRTARSSSRRGSRYRGRSPASRQQR